MGNLLTIQQLQAEGMPKAIDWEIEAHQLWCLYGPSGQGKSQLLKAIADLIPHQGDIRLKQISVEDMPAPVWRRQVMYFAAETAWWLETVAEHFIQLPSEESLQEIGLETALLSQHPDQLSSGEKQRLAILRGLSFSPRVLLLDEVSANLDPESTLKIENLIHRYIEQSERAAIWISHDAQQRSRLTDEKMSVDTRVLYSRT